MCAYRTTLVRVSLSCQVYEHMKQAIILQEVPEFQMGAKINEAAVAKMFTCSVTPVREAINRLRRDGLIVGDSYQSSSIVRFTVQDVKNIFDVRKYLETGVLQQAMQKVTHKDIEYLRKCNNTYREAYERFDEEEIIGSNRLFHNHLVQLSGNELLLRMLESIQEQVAMLRAPIAQARQEKGDLSQLLLPVREHERLLDALEEESYEKAHDALIAHIERIEYDSVNHYRNALKE